MDYLTLVVAVLTTAAAAGGIAAWYKRSQGQDALALAQRVNDLLKDENASLTRKLTAAQAQMDIKDDVIERLTKDGKKRS